jgi:hypothetical protein
MGVNAMNRWAVVMAYGPPSVSLGLLLL